MVKRRTDPVSKQVRNHEKSFGGWIESQQLEE